jgi:hypothetical protein
MPTVTLATHCHFRDLPRLHSPGVLKELIEGHAYPFDEVLVVHQRCKNLPYELAVDARVLNVNEEDYPAVLASFGIDHQDPLLVEVTHGWSWQWYFAHHCVNHCKEILEAKSDYIVFNDADCRIISQPAGQSWVSRAVELMQQHSEIFIVSPSDGGHERNRVLPDGTRLVKTTSQQLFLGDRRRMREMDFTNLRWNGNFDAPGGPMQEWYGMWEGHMGRWMHEHGWYRAILPESYRYWHLGWH